MVFYVSICQVRTIFSFDRYRLPAQVIRAVETTSYVPGYTNTAGALRQAEQMYKNGKVLFSLVALDDANN